MVSLTGPDTGEISDADLLSRCVSGDRAAFGLIFDRYSRAVYAAASLIVEQAADAEDVLSESFLVFWRRRADIELFGGSGLPWLVTTARNLARNHRRATHRRGFVSLNDDIDSHGSASADSSADARRVAQQLEAMLSGLAPLDRQIIQLCLVDGTSYERAAQQLGLSHGAVRNRLARTRQHFRHALGTEREER